MTLRILAASLAALALSRPMGAGQLDGVFLESGHARSSHCDLTLTQLSLQKEIKAFHRGEEGWCLRGCWDLGLGCWKNNSSRRTNKDLADVGLTPILRLEHQGASSVTPYVEAGVGAHLLSHTSVSDFRRFGSAFEFGDHLGAGVRCGNRGRYDVSCRLQHISNAGIQSPNRGINYGLVRVGYHF